MRLLVGCEVEEEDGCGGVIVGWWIGVVKMWCGVMKDVFCVCEEFIVYLV